MKISFIGHGNMAKAMIAGILKSNLLNVEDIFCSDSDQENQKAIDFGDYIFLTIKPQLYFEVLNKLTLPETKVFIIVAPGIKTSSIPAKVVRIMPNTPALIGRGVTAICRNKLVNDKEFQDVISLLETFSVVYQLPEDQMDAVVPLSGSSPAYAYLFIAALADYANSKGIDYELALKMAAATLSGAAHMVLESVESPEVLCERVCSKGGTTIKAIEVLQKAGFKELLEEAMEACYQRALELAREYN